MICRWIYALTILPAFFPGTGTSQSGWQTYNGPLIAFRYPATWQLHVLADRDVVVADTKSPMSVEIAMSPGNPATNDQLALNAEKHVSQFAQMNGMVAKFEGYGKIESGAVRVISHVCADLFSDDLKFCAQTDQKQIQVSSITWKMNGQVVLVETMHKPGIGEARLNVAREIVSTLDFRK